jgi:hypothetical protein
MPQRPSPQAAQLHLSFESEVNRPPKAPPTKDLLQVLADLLLEAMDETASSARSREAGDEPEDRA